MHDKLTQGTGEGELLLVLAQHRDSSRRGDGVTEGGVALEEEKPPRGNQNRGSGSRMLLTPHSASGGLPRVEGGGTRLPHLSEGLRAKGETLYLAETSILFVH